MLWARVAFDRENILNPRRSPDMMRRITGLAMFAVAVSGTALAGIGGAPEIDPTAAVGALALLSGGVLVLRSRRRKR